MRILPPQDSVEVLMKAENAEICRRLRSQLSKLNDITKIIMRIKKASWWQSVKQSRGLPSSNEQCDHVLAALSA